MPVDTGQTEGQRIYDELIAVHTIMRRGAMLTAAALERLACGSAPSVPAIVRLSRWQTAFVHHHHQSEDELFWPVLRELFPAAVGSLDTLTEEHEVLDAELDNLATAVDRLAASAKGQDARAGSVGIAATEAWPAAEKVRDILVSHLNTEEPVLATLFPQTPADRITVLRKAIVAGAPKSAPDLVLGLLEDPEPAQGYDLMRANFPPPVRMLRPVLLRRYRSQKRLLEK